jgi:PAP2 superfamily
MRRHLVLKAIGTSVIIGIFFFVYLHLLHHPRFPVTVMPATELDRLVPFQPGALFLYLTLWLYVGAGPGLQLRWLELINYAAWSVLLCAAGLSIFYLWPTRIPSSGLDVSAHVGFAMLQGIDAAGNACPSMHVAFASFTAIRIDQVLRATGSPRLLRAANLGWATAIVYSTLAIRQHVVVDVGAGLLLGTVFALASLRWGLALPRLRATGVAASAIAARTSDA